MDNDFLKRAISAGDYDADVLRQIDALVAEKAMEWKITPDPNYHSLGGAMFAVQPDGSRKFLWHLRNGVSSGENGWTFTEDMAAAFLAVDKMRSLGWRFEMFDTAHDSWVVRFGRGEYNHHEDEWDEECKADNNSSALAICLAALKAVGVDI